MFDNKLFNFSGADTLTSTKNNVLDSACDLDISILVYLRQIAGPEITVMGKVIFIRFMGLKIARKYGRAFGYHLSRCVGREFLAVTVYDLEMGIRTVLLSYGVTDGINIIVQPCHGRRTFNRTECIDVFTADFLINTPDQLRCAWGTTAIYFFQGTKVIPLKPVKVQQPVDDGRNRRECGNLLLFYDPAYVFRLCGLSQNILGIRYKTSSQSGLYTLTVGYGGYSQQGVFAGYLPCPRMVFHIGDIIVMCPGCCFGHACSPACGHDLADLHGIRPPIGEPFQVFLTQLGLIYQSFEACKAITPLSPRRDDKLQLRVFFPNTFYERQIVYFSVSFRHDPCFRPCQSTQIAYLGIGVSWNQ